MSSFSLAFPEKESVKSNQSEDGEKKSLKLKKKNNLLNCLNFLLGPTVCFFKVCPTGGSKNLLHTLAP